jgi:hypothetical protein
MLNNVSNFGYIESLGTAAGIDISGDFSRITNAGSIISKGNGAEGIYIDGSHSTIINSGIVSSTGYGIYSEGDSNEVANTGSITTSGEEGAGVKAYYDQQKITNSGSIKTSGYIADGISYGKETLPGNSAVISNSGQISTVGVGASGILAFLNSSTIESSGEINTVGIGSYGLGVAGNSNVVRSSGAIITHGIHSHGIFSFGNSSVITNSGSISTDGEDAVGIYAIGDSNAVTNSGSIISAKSYAVYFDGSGNTLNILNNFLGGGVFMGSGGTVNITTGANYSKLYTFGGSSLTINGSGPIPLFINQTTQQAATYDPTIFASSSDALADMTSAISSLTPGRFNGTEKEHPIWARGFGTTSSYSGTYSGADTTLDRNYIFSGVALGYDAIRSKDIVIGLLGGYGQTSITADAESTQSFNNTSDGGFLGLYGQKRWKDWAFDFALYGGVQSFQQQRYVNDNLAYLGNSSTQASFQGWWLAPELAATVKLAEVNGWSLLPTARLRYAQQWMGGYTETGGGAANASVSGRNVTIGQSFVGVGTRKTIKTILGKNTKMVLDGQVGYMYRGAVGDDTVDVTMIGQSLSLPTEISSRNAVAVSAGVALDLSSAVTLKIRGDAAAGGGMNYVGGGWAGLSFKF